MKKIRLFVYDFDGTLVDSKLDIADSVNRALKELGLRELPREIIFGYIGDGVEALMSRALSAGQAPGGDAAMTLRDRRNPVSASAQAGGGVGSSGMLAGAPSLDSCMKKIRLFVYDFDGT
ncbi:MAG: HAD hydrolase-like protein, partial [Nitrospinae bacterium]|nr:HAD hydrolase-like protein [Nitrospinota bacterium]